MREKIGTVAPENSSAKILIWTLRVAQLTLAKKLDSENVKNFRTQINPTDKVFSPGNLCEFLIYENSNLFTRLSVIVSSRISKVGKLGRRRGKTTFCAYLE